MSVGEHKLREYLERATTALRKAKAKLRAFEERHHEPIAIVGMACRFPGRVSTPGQLWELLDAGRDAITAFPRDRGWPLAELYDPEPDTVGTTYTRGGGFITHPGRFDPEFFGISPREAVAMDPQQRLLLQLSWEALERARIVPATIAESNTGVFVGVCYDDYLSLVPSPAQARDGYATLGNLYSATSGRIAYCLGLQGPTLTLDTACSTSLVAIHLAVQALRRGECDRALCGGATTFSTPEPLLSFSRLRTLSPDGRCKAFSAEADGAGWAEGAGMVVLERLSDARRSGRAILALVGGSAVNQDGRSQGFTAPNGPAQQRVIRAALADARIGAREVDVVEAHGTGTSLGDPIEANAIQAVYGKAPQREGPLWLGTIKSNLGHTQAAAGIAGVMKMVLALNKERLPMTLHAERGSPLVDWAAGAMVLAKGPQPWLRGDRVRRGGVSSFGISGTNAHVIVEEAPPPSAAPSERRASRYLLPISARTSAQLRGQASELAGWIGSSASTLAQLSLSLATTRTHFEQRRALVVGSRDEAVRVLEGLAAGEAASQVVAAPYYGEASLAGLFTGQGSQRPGMGAELYREFPVFRASFDACCAYFDLKLNASLRATVFCEPDSEQAANLAQTRYAQPALFALELALYRLYESWGVRPGLLLGHSLGEIVAAHIAGVFSLEDACSFVELRSSLMQALPAGGAMASIAASTEAVRATLGSQLGAISVAAINGPEATVISGEAQLVERVVESFAARGHSTRRLAVSHAFHSPLMEPMLEHLRAHLVKLDYRAPQIPVVSNLTGRIATAEEICDPSYWVDHVRRAVAFHEGVRSLERWGFTVALEYGPQGVLCAMTRSCLSDELAELIALVPSLRREDSEVGAVLAALGRLHCAGIEVDWAEVIGPAKLVDLPTYRFANKLYWVDPGASLSDGRGGSAQSLHPMLVSTMTIADGDGLLFSGTVSLSTHPWLEAHVVYGRVLFPGTAFVELALAAAGQLGLDRLEQLTVESPLELGLEDSISLQILLSSHEDPSLRTIAIHSRSSSSAVWTRHAHGLVGTQGEWSTTSWSEWPPPGAEAVDLDDFYAALAHRGLRYGLAFRGLRGCWANAGGLFAELHLPQVAGEAGRFALHPALFDAAFHPLVLDGSAPEDTVPLPFSYAGVYFAQRGQRSLRVWLDTSREGEVRLEFMGTDGRRVGVVEGVNLRPVSFAQLGVSASSQRGQLHTLEWVPLSLEADSPVDPGWAVVGAGLEQLEYPSYPSLAALLDAEEPAGGVVVSVVEAGSRALKTAQLGLELLQTWESEPRLRGRVLAVVTSGAVEAIVGEGAPSHGGASLWGLARAAARELVGLRLALIDVEQPAQLAAVLARVDGSAARELAARGSAVLTSELARLDTQMGVETLEFEAQGTVMIIGGTGGLGALFAKHLVEAHGVRSLLLCSRRGPDSPVAARLGDELAALGARAQFVACDAAQWEELAAALARISPETPLSAVLHCAGVLDDGTLASLDRSRLEAVFHAKVEAMRNIEELTRDGPPIPVIAFSSLAGVIGTAGQANYAAANAWLDAFAAQQRAQGRPYLSIAWGPWGGAGMAARLSSAERKRLRRSGLATLAVREGLAMFDAALGAARSCVIGARFELDGEAVEGLPPALEALLGAHQRRAPVAAIEARGQSLLARAAGLEHEELDALLLDTVTREAALVLGSDTQQLEKERALQELGLDSLMAVELRARLQRVSGLSLRSTLLFDYPTPAKLVGHLRGLIESQIGRVAAPVGELGELRQELRAPAQTELREDTPRREDTSRREDTASQVETASQREGDAQRPRTTEDPLVIVSMACRFPGGISSPEQLWEALSYEADLISDFPRDRGWDLSTLFDPDPEHPGTSISSEGGFLKDAAHFDPRAFGISPREASVIDPQQRLLLECAWEAVERARIPVDSLRGTATGVFAGIMYSDYGSRVYDSPQLLEGSVLIGSAASVASGRIAYSLGLEGPALTVDTACSSSLVALHLACQAIRRGECDQALVGGATVMSTPAPFIEFSRQRGLAGDGRCKSYSEDADGVGWSEGAVVVLVERESLARAQGHPILARVLASSINQDGRSQGLTAPVGPAQERVIRAALANAGLEPAAIDVVEGHGTGTRLGDPIEIVALQEVHAGRLEAGGAPLWLGSIKSNMGHTQAAAGLAGVIKMILALAHERLPASRYAERPSRAVAWEGGVELLREAQAWARGERVRRAGVSAFGISGTNAHVVLEEGPELPRLSAPQPAHRLPGHLPLVVSARTDAAVLAQHEHLASLGLPPLGLAYSLLATRSLLKRGAAAVVSATGEVSATQVPVPTRKGAKVALLFTGQGSQRLGMGRELSASYPSFRMFFDDICERLSVHLGARLRRVMHGDDPDALTRTLYAQPALFALEVALYRTLELWGVEADVLLGHSIGELAAAHVAGVFSLDDACKLVAARARLMEAAPDGGVMVSVRGKAELIEVELEGFEDPEGVAIAAINGPESTVISGDAESTLSFAAELEAQGYETRRLRVSHAFHSPHMEAMLEEFALVAASIDYRSPKIALISNVSGALAGPELCTPEYWVAQVRATVRFQEGVAVLEQLRVGVCIELGPSGTLCALAHDCLSATAASKTALIPMLRRARPESQTLAEGLARLHLHGVALDWSTYFEPFEPELIALPTYAFQRRRYWLDRARSTPAVPAAPEVPGVERMAHPLLAAVVPLADVDAFVFSAAFELERQAWLGEHRVAGRAIVPATALVEIGLAAGAHVGMPRLDELTLAAPIHLERDAERTVLVSVGEPTQGGQRSLSIHSRLAESSAPEWTLHAEGVLALAQAQRGAAVKDWPPAGAKALELAGLYAGLEARGLEYGPAFTGLVHAWSHADERYVELRLDRSVESEGFGLHPALLDAALHVLAHEAPAGQLTLPFAWSGVELVERSDVAARELKVVLRPSATGGGHGLELYAGSGVYLGSIESFVARAASFASFTPALAARAALYRVAWRPLAPRSEQDPHSGASASAPVVLPGLDEGDAAPEALAALAASGDGPALVLVPCWGRASSALAATTQALALIQQWLQSPRLEHTQLTFVTRCAVAVDLGESVVDLNHAPLWGLVRAVQREHPERELTIVDVDVDEPAQLDLAELARHEGQLALRAEQRSVPRLVAAADGDALRVPAQAQTLWRVAAQPKGSVDNLQVVDEQRVDPLPAGHVRVELRAAGLNFRDVLTALDMYPGEPGPLGYEGAGVVRELAPEVSGLAVGDAVMGLGAGAFTRELVVDARYLVALPRGWSMNEGASVPLVFLTAWYALVDLAQLRAGERVLIHAAAGGVGMAAVQIARLLGAEVFATASPPKWAVLHDQGFDGRHISNSRSLEFEAEILAATEGAGVDVVLDALAGDFVDASLRLLPRGGRFVEMGKRDLRDPAEVAAAHPGVVYRAFDVTEAGYDRMQAMLIELQARFESGELRPLPTRSWDLVRARDAFRFVAQARHIGKVVLCFPSRLSGEGTVLVTGATGALGALVCRHLVQHHGVRRLLLLSRSGPAASRATSLRAELEAAGARVELRACDVARREALVQALASIASDAPLRAIFHLAGVLDDGVIPSQTPARLAGVFAPKVEAARLLAELSVEMRLDAFVLFSSVAGVLGSPGQTTYAAANAYLDALATKLRGEGRPACALAWGPWAGAGMAASLSAADLARLQRAGFEALDPADGLALLDNALMQGEPALVPLRLDTRALAEAPRMAMLSELQPAKKVGAARRSSRGSDAGQVDELPDDSGPRARGQGLRAGELLELVRAEAAAVLALPAPEIDGETALQELGLDSLVAVELRDRLQLFTGLRLPSTFLFDYPSLELLVGELTRRMGLEQQPGRLATPAPLERSERSERSESSKTPAALVRRARGAGAHEGKDARGHETHEDDAIAIVAMACRFPGGVESPEDLWELVLSERDAISAFPQDRGWQLDALYDPDPAQAGKTYARAGGFLSRPDLFDAELFGISPREALELDPQQRLLLELSWEALERARIDPSSLLRSPTGVYVGTCYSDYLTRSGTWREASDGYQTLGNAASTVSGRISYTLGLEGPAVSLDTACSTSLVALHLASQALRNGECNLALVGGATVFATADPFVAFSRLRTLSPDGRSKAFSTAADGAGWAEGAGIVVLERLVDARAKGRNIRAIVRGSAINHDGRSQGLTAPNGPAQQRVIRAALSAAGLGAGEVDVVEAHGTGTRLGDPIEAEALRETYGAARGEGSPLWLGTVKSNIGHTQAASGVAGVIKMVLAMEQGLLPRTLHAEQPSQEIDWSAGTMALLQQARPWTTRGGPRRAGVSAFGISGTNAHVILEQGEAPRPASPQAAAAAAGVEGERRLPLIVSAKGEAAVRAQFARLKASEAPLRDAAYTLVRARAQLSHRAFALVGACADLGELELDALEVQVARGEPKLALLFTGQGAQRVGMGRELHAREPRYRASFDATCAQFDAHLDRPLRELVFGDDPELLARTSYTQPALFAVEVALFRLFEAWGVRPCVLVGHSIGELAAAHVAGVLSLPDACRLVAARGRLMQALPSSGAMLALRASEVEVEQLLADLEGVEIASFNGPRALVVSGDEAGIVALAQRCAAVGIEARRLLVSHAFHSHHMDGMLEQLRALAGELHYAEAEIPVVSTLTGRLVSGEELRSADYWAAQVRNPVRFAAALEAVKALGVELALELGPRGVLSAMLAEAQGPEGGLRAIPSLRGEDRELDDLAEALAQLHCRGVRVEWEAFFAEPTPRLCQLPTYAFQRQRYWTQQAPPPTHEDGDEEQFWRLIEEGDADALNRSLALAGEEARSLERLLPALRGWRAQARAHTRSSAWVYASTWVLAALPQPGSSGAWLVVMSADQAERGELEGVLVALADAGVELRRLALDPNSSRAELDQALESAPLAGVSALVCLAGMDERVRGRASSLSVGVALSLRVLQALAARAQAAPLYFVTQRAVAIAGEAGGALRAAQAAVWGLGRVAALEHAGHWGGLIDLGELADARHLPAAVASELGELALRGAQAHTRQLRARPPTSARPYAPRGTILITGGSGALAGVLARQLASAGAQRLVLASRRGDAAEHSRALAAELEAQGTAVSLVRCDVSKREALAGLLEQLEHSSAPLSSVFHCAGVVRDGLLRDLQLADFDEVFAPKLDAAHHLVELLAHAELDALVLFSSLAGQIGNAGQANYAAANAVLDALAQRHASAGRRVLSVAWGPWQGAGMAEDLGEALAQRGLRALEPQAAVGVLMRLLGAPGQASPIAPIVADVDWEQLASHMSTTATRSVLSSLAPQLEPEPAAQAQRTAGAELHAALRAMNPQRQQARLLELVCELTAKTTRSGVRRPDPDMGFGELGLDSLMAVELRTQLQTRAGVTLPATLTFDHPTPRHAARFILSELHVATPPPESSADSDIRELLARVPIEQLRASGLLSRLLSLSDEAAEISDPDARANSEPTLAEAVVTAEDVVMTEPEFEQLSDDALLDAALSMLDED